MNIDDLHNSNQDKQRFITEGGIALWQSSCLKTGLTILSELCFLTIKSKHAKFQLNPLSIGLDTSWGLVVPSEGVGIALGSQD